MLWLILIQFLFRASFGLALAMALTSPKQVTAGFYRVHSWVLLGVSTFACVVVFIVQQEFEHAKFLMIGSGMAAFLSYVAAVIWLYEKARPGTVLLFIVAGLNLYLGCNVGVASNSFMNLLDVLTSGMIIGVTFAAMLLGHWYLNTPTMKLEPLKRLTLGIAGAIALRAALCAFGDWQQVMASEAVTDFFWGAVSLRWLAGLIGLLVVTVMTWKTLKIPNTQSATGILYVGVIFVFIGELASQLLAISIGSQFPL